MTIVCPKCQHDDQIESVPGIVAHETVHTKATGSVGGLTYSGGELGTAGGVANMKGIQQTELAKLLAAPTLPTSKGVGCLVVMITALSLGAIYFSLEVPALLRGYDAAVHWEKFVYFLLCVGGIVFLIFNFNKQNKLQSERYTQLYPKWEKAMQRWKRSYYCSRDNIVFDPETDQYEEPNKLNGFLYS